MAFRNGRQVISNTTSLQLNDILPAGTLLDFASNIAPAGFLTCVGQAVSRTTYANLYQALVVAPGFTAQTFTVTIANPAVVTKTAHGFFGGERVRLSTTGALPTGLNTTTDYFVVYINANTFNLKTTLSGTNIITTGTQSGVHSYTQNLYGLGDGSTTFNLPDFSGRGTIGLGTYNDPVSSAIQRNIGQHLGAEAHILTATQTGVASHTHNHPHTHGVATQYWNNGAAIGGSSFIDTNTLSAGSNDGLTPVVGSTANTAILAASTDTVPAPTTAPASNSHNNMQPSIVVSKIIKY